MSRNGSGSYTPPGASFPAVSGATIDSAKFNAVINDIGSALTQSIANDGQTVIAANLPMSGFKHTGVAAATVTGQYAEYAQMNTAIATSVATAVAGLNGRNVLINGGFTINQRGYVSSSALAAGSYGHDRWKAGASGGDYSFTQLNSNTQITITAAKTLIQVVEDKNVHSSSYVLSWTGTAQARYAVNSATPAGAYAASPIVITGQTAGSTMSVEFNAGTLSKAQLESGATASVFEYRHYSKELERCQRYYFRITATGTGLYLTDTGVTTSTVNFLCQNRFPVQMRTAPTALEQDGTATDYQVLRGGGATVTVCSSVPVFHTATTEYTAGTTFIVAAGLSNGLSGAGFSAATGAYLGWSAEL